jgi:hypothetical protein
VIPLSTNLKELKMKMHVLTAAVLTVLASQAGWAASEGGDTWSSVQALRDAGDQDTQQASSGTSMEYAGLPGGSEGGDTWSSVAPVLESAPTSATGLAAATTHE